MSGVFAGVISLCHFTLCADFGLNLWVRCDASAQRHVVMPLTGPRQNAPGCELLKGSNLCSSFWGLRGLAQCLVDSWCSINICWKKSWRIPVLHIGYTTVRIWGRLSHPIQLSSLFSNCRPVPSLKTPDHDLSKAARVTSWLANVYKVQLLENEDCPESSSWRRERH